MTALGDFLREGGARRREIGEWDCATYPAAWAIACGYPDPLARWRGAYATEDEARQLMTDCGGLVEMYAAGIADAGIPETTAPYEAGDIGVIRLIGEQAGAIYTGERWALCAERGMTFAKLDDACVLRAWRPAHG